MKKVVFILLSLLVMTMVVSCDSSNSEDVVTTSENSSKSEKVCDKTLSMQAGRYFSTLYTGTITEKNIIISYLLLSTTSTLSKKYNLCLMPQAKSLCLRGKVFMGYAFKARTVRLWVHTSDSLFLRCGYLILLSVAYIIS